LGGVSISIFVPTRAAERLQPRDFGRPFGTRGSRNERDPRLESLGYFRASLSGTRKTENGHPSPERKQAFGQHALKASSIQFQTTLRRPKRGKNASAINPWFTPSSTPDKKFKD
jgi:hypothetical protein